MRVFLLFDALPSEESALRFGTTTKSKKLENRSNEVTDYANGSFVTLNLRKPGPPKLENSLCVACIILFGTYDIKGLSALR